MTDKKGEEASVAVVALFTLRALGKARPKGERGESLVRIEGEIVIDRPVEEVFDSVADERNEPRVNPKMLRTDLTSEGPIERPHRLASTTRMSSVDLRGVLTFDAPPKGTRIRWSWDVEPRDILRMVSPLVARAERRQEQRIWTGLKHLLERPTASTSSTG